MKNELLKRIALNIRRNVVDMIYNAQGGHLGTSLSEIEILTALFFSVMNVDPDKPDMMNRDRFVLSKGHGSEGLYCTLYERGYFPKSWIDNYLQKNCLLTIHPTTKIPGIESCTGALGHGLSIAVGIALSAKLNKSDYRCFVLTGDGELQEGSNWEAAMAASHYKLSNLVWIIDNNKLQLFDKVSNTLEVEPLKDKLISFGFEVFEVDGNNVDEVNNLLMAIDYSNNTPHAIIAHTIKGKGVSFAENVTSWHHKIPTKAEWNLAMEELGNE